ncbi:MAG: hypothetical protein VX641_00545 [Planctomycetota bacterium]|nr:hypothetical protein [Planctomycetota bacterium]
MNDSSEHPPNEPPGTEHIELVDLPGTFDEGDRRRFTDMLNWINTAMLVTCNRTEPGGTDPLPLRLIGQAIPHPRLLEIMHAGIATMADNIHQSLKGGTEAFRRELIAQALHQETALPIDDGRTYAIQFCPRLDAGDDENLMTLAALTRDGFRAFILAISTTPDQAEALIEPLKEIAIGCRVVMGSVLHLLIQDLESILSDLGISTSDEELERYRDSLTQVLKSVQA